MDAKSLVEDLALTKNLKDEELIYLLTSQNIEVDSYLANGADQIRRSVYGTDVYIRGLIEFTNYCKNNCYYCGIRCGNIKVDRYRLSKEEILECCREGYELGFRTFVLQGGEDPYYTDEVICDIVSSIRGLYPDCAITLSIGEKNKESYKAYFEAGANRFLLRHETATSEHYRKLHPQNLSLENRMKCLRDLKEIGYQVGSGFMVGSPYQRVENLVEDIRFLQELQPDMIGIGPFLPHKDTPFREFAKGSLTTTLRLISILRIMFPNALIPSTTALGTLQEKGREMGLKAGANVVMPNLSPLSKRKLYQLYNNKICTDEEGAEGLTKLKESVSAAGYQIVVNIGNVKK